MAKKKVAKKVAKKKVVKKTSTAIATKADTAVANVGGFLPEELQGVFDPSLMGATADKDDIIISKAWLLQQMSEAVTDDDKEGISGQYRNSRTLELIAAKGASFEAIVIDNYKTWQCFEEDGDGESQYTKTLNYHEYPQLKYDDVNPTTGRKIHRDLVLGYFVLLMDEVMEGNAFPLIVDFKRTSRESGKSLATSIAQLASKKIPSYAMVYTFGSEQKTKEIGGREHRYYVKTVNEGRWINKDELAVIQEWARELSKKKSEGKVSVDETDLKSSPVQDDSNTIETTATTVKGKSRF